MQINKVNFDTHPLLSETDKLRENLYPSQGYAKVHSELVNDNTEVHITCS